MRRPVSVENLVDSLRQALGDRLVSVVLYGSRAVGDALGEASDINLLVVCSSLGLPELDALLDPVARWTAAGQPPPRFFTHARLRQSADTFAIEISDIRAAHRVLHGEDPLRDLVVSPQNLRLQLERELKSKLLLLRQAYLQAGQRPRDLAELLVTSLSSFQALFRAAARLYDPAAPLDKRQASHLLARHLGLDPAILDEIAIWKAQKRPPRGLSPADARAAFARYLTLVENVVDAIDARPNPPSL